MISRSRNQTVPRWAIAAHTLSRVKETKDNEKNPQWRKKKSLSTKHKVRVVLVLVVVPWSVLPCVPVTVASSTSTKPYDPCPLLLIPAPLLHPSNT